MSSPVRVLYVDDDPLDRELVRDALEREHGGFAVTEAASRQEFEARLAAGTYDVVLSDFNILGFDGLAVLDAVRAVDPTVPVVIVTGTGSEEVAAEAIKRGAADYVIKSPRHIRRLPQTIHAALDKVQQAEKRVRAEEAQRESEQKFRYLFVNNPHPMWVYDLQTLAFLEVNDAAVAKYGYSRAEFLRMGIAEIRPPEDVARLLVDVKKDRPAMQFSGAWRHRCKDGTLIDVEITSHTLEFTGRKAALVVAQDITRRKQAEESLRLQSAALASAADAIVITDRAGDTRWVNPAFTSLTGYSAAEVIGQNPRLLKSGSHDNAFYKSLWDTILAGETWRGEIVNRRKDGSLYTEEESITPVRDAGGEITHFVAIKQDITERKRIEEAEREQRALAEALRDTAAALTSTLSFDEVLDRILVQVSRVVPHDAARILLVEEGVARTVRSRGYAEPEPAAPIPTPHGPVDAIANLRAMSQTGRPLAVPDTRSYPGWVGWPKTRWIRSNASAPIKIKERVIGFLGLDSAQPGFFTQAHAERLQAFADQAGIALENARLLAETQQRAAHQTALNAIITAVTRVGADLDALLDIALEHTLQALGLEIGAVWLLPTPQESQHVALRGVSKEISAAMVQTAAMHRYDILAAVAVADWHDHAPPFAEAFASLGIRASLTVPLLTEGRRIGGLSLAAPAPRAWSPEEVALIEAVGRQLGAAAERARLFQETHRRARELAALYETALAISGILDTGALLTGLHERVRQLIAADGFIVAFYDAGAEEFEIALALEESRSVPELVGLRKPLTDGGLTGWVLRNRKTLLIGDLEREPAPAQPNVSGRPGRSWLGVPLGAHNRLIGAVSVQAFRPHAFGEDDRRLLESLAAPVAIALDNARLYDEVRRHAAELEQKVAERTAELTQREAALRAVNEQLQQLSRLKSEFVSNVSHELRTPLTNIKTYLWLLERGKPEKHAKYMETLHRETELLQRLIEDLLHLSRLDLGKAKPVLASVDVNQTVKLLVGDRAILFADRGLTLEARVAPDLPLIQADEKMLIQMLTNLMTNAMNYTPAGGVVTVSTRGEWGSGGAEEQGRGGAGEQGRKGADVIRTTQYVRNTLPAWVTFSVSDTGPGISTEDQARLFERFYRGEAARLTRAPGTGLGLAICGELVERHGGRLTLESQLGAGSTFTVWLPVTQAQT